MGLRLQRAALPELLAHPAHRRHAKPQKFRDLSSALVPFIELQNAPTHGKRYGSHKRTLSHLFLFVKLYYLWKCSSDEKCRTKLLPRPMVQATLAAEYFYGGATRRWRNKAYPVGGNARWRESRTAPKFQI